MRSIIRLSEGINALSEAVGKTVSWGAGILVVMVFLDTSLRYIFSKTSVAVQEMEWHLFSIIFLLGAAYTLKHNGHVRVDFIYHRLSKRSKALIDCLGCLLFLFPGCYLVIHSAIPFVDASWSINESSPDPGGLPARWLLKAVLPVGFGLVALQGIAFFLKNLFVLFNIKKSEEKK